LEHHDSILYSWEQYIFMILVEQKYIVESKLSKFILMMPKTQVKNQESNKFQESKSCSIKNQDSVKFQENTQDMQELQEPLR